MSVVHFKACKSVTAILHIILAIMKEFAFFWCKLQFSRSKMEDFQQFWGNLYKKVAVASWDHQKSKLHTVADGFWVAELRVQQVKIGSKSCFAK